MSKKNSHPTNHSLISKSTCNISHKSSPIANDGSFIESSDLKDGFASINTVRYGEEVDADDL